MPDHLPPLLTSPSEVATAFFAALEARHLDAMMVLWAEDEEITCTHPGGPRLIGYPAIRESWTHIFTSNTQLSFRLDDIVAIETVGLATQSAHVWVYSQEGALRGAVIVTTVFLRTPIGWRLVSYHASPAPEEASQPATNTVH